MRETVHFEPSNTWVLTGMLNYDQPERLGHQTWSLVAHMRTCVKYRIRHYRFESDVMYWPNVVRFAMQMCEESSAFFG